MTLPFPLSSSFVCWCDATPQQQGCPLKWYSTYVTFIHSSHDFSKLLRWKNNYITFDAATYYRLLSLQSWATLSQSVLMTRCGSHSLFSFSRPSPSRLSFRSPSRSVVGISTILLTSANRSRRAWGRKVLQYQMFPMTVSDEKCGIKLHVKNFFVVLYPERKKFFPCFNTPSFDVTIKWCADDFLIICLYGCYWWTRMSLLCRIGKHLKNNLPLSFCFDIWYSIYNLPKKYCHSSSKLKSFFLCSIPMYHIKIKYSSICCIVLQEEC